MVVGKTLGVRAGAGGVAELHLGELLGSLDDEGLVAEAVGEDNVAAVVSELGGGVIAGLGLGDVVAELVLILGQAQLLNGGVGSVDEVEVVGGVLIVQEDETDLEILGDAGGAVGSAAGGGVVRGSGGVRSNGAAVVAAGGEGEDHHQREKQRKKLLHFCSSKNLIYLKAPLELKTKKGSAHPYTAFGTIVRPFTGAG